jgi:DNA-binding NarL/FixJ family response regulator
MKLLLVEPSILLRERLAVMLASLGCAEIVESIAVEDANRIMRLMQPEIVVMDARLPDDGGRAALARARCECPSACLIVVSSYSSEPYRKRWLQAGADHFFDLSAQIDLLLNVVRRHSQTHPYSVP